MVQQYSHDSRTEHIISLHDDIKTFRTHIFGECSDFINRIQQINIASNQI